MTLSGTGTCSRPTTNAFSTPLLTLLRYTFSSHSEIASSQPVSSLIYFFLSNSHLYDYIFYVNQCSQLDQCYSCVHLLDFFFTVNKQLTLNSSLERSMFRPSGVYSYEEQKYIYYNDIENISIKYMEIAHSLTF